MKKNILIFIFVFALTIVLTGCGKKSEEQKNKEKKNNNNENTEVVTEDKVDIIDVNSNTRPFAVVVNNTPVAVKVQEGLNKAYIVYELPTEGSTSRLLALYKDIDNVKIGTVRSARHNFIDFALESNAILVAYGWSEFAMNELK